MCKLLHLQAYFINIFGYPIKQKGPTGKIKNCSHYNIGDVIQNTFCEKYKRKDSFLKKSDKEQPEYFA